MVSIWLTRVPAATGQTMAAAGPLRWLSRISGGPTAASADRRQYQAALARGRAELARGLIIARRLEDRTASGQGPRRRAGGGAEGEKEWQHRLRRGREPGHSDAAEGTPEREVPAAQCEHRAVPLGQREDRAGDQPRHESAADEVIRETNRSFPDPDIVWAQHEESAADSQPRKSPRDCAEEPEAEESANPSNERRPPS